MHDKRGSCYGRTARPLTKSCIAKPDTNALAPAGCCRRTVCQRMAIVSLHSRAAYCPSLQVKILANPVFPDQGLHSARRKVSTSSHDHLSIYPWRHFTAQATHPAHGPLLEECRRHRPGTSRSTSVNQKGTVQLDRGICLSSARFIQFVSKPLIGLLLAQKCFRYPTLLRVTSESCVPLCPQAPEPSQTQCFRQKSKMSINHRAGLKSHCLLFVLGLQCWA